MGLTTSILFSPSWHSKIYFFGIFKHLIALRKSEYDRTRGNDVLKTAKGQSLPMASNLGGLRHHNSRPSSMNFQRF